MKKIKYICIICCIILVISGIIPAINGIENKSNINYDKREKKVSCFYNDLEIEIIKFEFLGNKFYDTKNISQYEFTSIFCFKAYKHRKSS